MSSSGGCEPNVSFAGYEREGDRGSLARRPTKSHSTQQPDQKSGRGSQSAQWRGRSANNSRGHKWDATHHVEVVHEVEQLLAADGHEHALRALLDTALDDLLHVLRARLQHKYRACTRTYTRLSKFKYE